MVKQMKLNTQLATASLPRHKKHLQHQYGALADAVLAEAVSGRAWGLPAVSFHFPTYAHHTHVHEYLCIRGVAVPRGGRATAGIGTFKRGQEGEGSRLKDPVW